MHTALNEHDLWKYLDPDVLSQDGISEEELSEKVLQGFQSWMNDVLPSILEEETAESVGEINKALEEFATAQFSSLTDAATDGLKTSLATAFQQWANSSPSPASTPTSANSSVKPSGTLPIRMEELSLSDTCYTQINQRLTKFFQDDDWSFTHLAGENALHLAFIGENGRWHCIAQAREDKQTIAFYSICPIATPENRRGAIAEFITRANYGMVIGNFEMDFSDGEIRYKTSIDVEGSVLNSALIRQLVYTNVLTMDQYLPGILAVIEEGVEPGVAVERVE
ncbi:MAG: YbjN domain-containing protein [Cyanobacteria bacterium P01_F01_bin.150]